MRILLVLLLGSAFALGQNVVTMPITDNSDVKSPIGNVGTITLSEEIKDGKTYDSEVYNLTAKNVSDKEIVTFVEKLFVGYPSGSGEAIIEEKDSFFGHKLVEPGDAIDFSQKDPGGQIVMDQRASPPNKGLCNVRVLYAQFADGTTFGNEEYGVHILGVRRDIWNVLGHLNAVYQKQGEQAFVEELQKPVPSNDVKAFLDMFRSVQKEKGTQSNVGLIQKVLSDAEERQARINAGSASHEVR
ncbi:MAG: hypothetical protein WCA13_14160 [Terriglobales bacterium]